jgi:hypothetical protein
MRGKKKEEEVMTSIGAGVHISPAESIVVGDLSRGNTDVNGKKE